MALHIIENIIMTTIFGLFFTQVVNQAVLSFDSFSKQDHQDLNMAMIAFIVIWDLIYVVIRSAVYVNLNI